MSDRMLLLTMIPTQGARARATDMVRRGRSAGSNGRIIRQELFASRRGPHAMLDRKRR
jgi:hypothetical protein